eukprot:g2072.t1
MPQRGQLRVAVGHNSVSWSRTRTGLCARRCAESTTIDVACVSAIVKGRCSDNFTRTAKYTQDHKLPELELRCLTVIHEPDGTDGGGGDADSRASLSLEFEQNSTRDNFAEALLLMVRRRRPRLDFTPNITSTSMELKPHYDTTRARLVARALEIIQSPPVERFILLCILANMCTMAANSAYVSQETKDRLEFAELGLNCVYTLEAALRIFSLEGLWPYLFDGTEGGWNQLDFAIVLLGWFTFLNAQFGGPDIGGLTAFRAFRALRTMRFVEGIRNVLDTFAGTLNLIGQAIVCYFYFLWLSAVFGMQTFGSVITASRCAYCICDTTGATAGGVAQVPNATACAASCAEAGAAYTAAPERFCVHNSDCNTAGGQFCAPVGELAAFGRSLNLYRPEGDPSRPFTGFGDFETAMSTVFLITAKSGMKYTMDAAIQTSSNWSVIFFVLTIVIVSFVLGALFIAIVRAAFIAQKKKRQKELAEIKKAKDQKRDIERQRDALRAMQSKLCKLMPSSMAEGVLFPASRMLNTLRSSAADAKMQPVARDDVASTLEGIDTSTQLDQQRQSEDGVAAVAVPVSLWWDVLAFDTAKSPAKYFKKLVEHPVFSQFISLAILVNTIFLASEHYDMDPAFASFLDAMEIFFAFLFLAEILVKSVGLGGFEHFWNHEREAQWNRFDFIIVVASLVDVSMSLAGGGEGVKLSVLRTFRILRIVRLIRRNKKLADVLHGVLKSLSAMFNLLAFMLLVIIVFAILGMKMYGGKLGGSPSKPPRSNFDTFSDACLTMFKLFSGGGTVGIFFDVMQVGPGSYVFFLLYNIFTVYITLNFLIVILCSSFAPTKQEIEVARREVELSKKNKMIMGKGKQPRHSWNDFSNMLRGKPVPIADTWREKAFQRFRRCMASTRWAKNIDAVSEWMVQREEWSLWTFPPGGRVRVFCGTLVDAEYFERFIIFCIVFSSICLCLESPYPPYDHPDLLEFLRVCDILFLIIFCIEFLLKIVAMGVVFTPESYWGDSWNRLDFFVLFVTVLGMSGAAGQSGVGRVFRVGRILRPLRMINRNEGMKVIINALLQSIVPIMYTCALIGAFFVFFAILGLTLFGGKFYRCNDPVVGLYKQACVGVFMHPELGHPVPRVWANPGYSFDNIFESLRVLFEVVTRKGWTPVLYSAMDATDVGKQPRRDASFWNMIFFVVFVFMGNFYLFKVFVGIIVAHFRKFSGTALLTDAQLQWVATKRMLSKYSPQRARPSNPIRGRAFTIVSNQRFSTTMTALILLHLIFLSAETSTQSSAKGAFMNGAHWVFTSFYGIEIVLRIIANGRKHFSTLGFLETGAVVLMFVLPVTLPAGRSGVGPVRALFFSRVVDLIRVSGYFGEMQKLFDTLTNCSLAMTNITALFSLFVFVYAVFGLQMFATVKHGMYLNGNQNFETFGQSLLTLFQVASGENWIKIMRDMSQPESTCLINPLADAKSRTDCGSPIMAYVVFSTFYIMVFCVFLNLYVAAILDTYSSSGNGGQSLLLNTGKCIDHKHFDRFQQVFVEFDKRGSGRISARNLEKFLVRLGPPLGLTATGTGAETVSSRAHTNHPGGGELFAHLASSKLRRQKMLTEAVEYCQSRSTLKLKVAAREPKLRFGDLLRFTVMHAVKHYGEGKDMFGIEERLQMEQTDELTIAHLKVALILQQKYREHTNKVYDESVFDIDNKR